MKGEGEGEYLHLGVGRVSLGKGVGPRIGGGESECGGWSGVMGGDLVEDGWIQVVVMVLRDGEE